MQKRLILTGCLVAASYASAQAAVLTWDNGAGTVQFGDALNWSGDALPVDGDTLQFTSTALAGTVTNNLALTDLQFSFSASGYTLGGNSILGNAGGVGITLSPAVTATINNDFDLNGTALTLTGGTDSLLQLNGNITDTSGITAQTGGTFALNGTTTANITVNDATVLIGDRDHPDASLTGNVTVTNGGFGGSGSMTGDVTITNGRMYAGSTPGGFFTINGNYTHDATSRLDLYFTPGHGPALTVTGTASMGGDIVVNMDKRGVYGQRTYTVLSSANRVILGGVLHGQATAVPGYLVSVGLGNPNTTVTLTPMPFDLTDGTPMYSTVSRQLQHNSTGTIGRLLTRLETLSHTTTSPKPMQVALADTGYFSDAWAALVPSAGGSNNPHPGAWVSGIGGVGHMDNHDSTPGYAGSSGGMMGGVDRWINDDQLLGISAAYTLSKMHLKSTLLNKTETTTLRGTVYGMRQLPVVDIGGTLGYAQHRVATHREVAAGGAIAGGSYNVHELSAALQASAVHEVQGVRLIPSIGMQYTYLLSESFREKDAGLLALTVKPDGTDSLQPFVGVAATTDFAPTSDNYTFSPTVRVKYRYETLDTAHNNLVFFNYSGYRSNGLPISPDAVELGTSLNIVSGTGTSVNADYTANLYTGTGKDQTFSLGLKYKL